MSRRNTYEMSMSDSFYIALCMTALILGAVYWFWTQTQYIQRKVNLLENIVYEMKAALSNNTLDDALDDGKGGALGTGGESAASPAVYAPPPLSDQDVDEAALHAELSAAAAAIASVEAPSVSAPAANAATEALHAASDIQDFHGFDGGAAGGSLLAEDGLQPGGVGSGMPIESDDADMHAKPSVLAGMTLKELRRLAEQKGIAVKNHMRKQELIDAIHGVIPATGAVANVVDTTVPAIQPFDGE